jgi:hypothetical protein
MSDLDLKTEALADLDGRRLAARIFAVLGLAEGALVIPRIDAELAVSIALCHGAQIDHMHHIGQRHCRVCGCGELTACRGPDGPCSWVGPDLCSTCANFEEPRL